MAEAVYGCKKYMYYRYYSDVIYFLNYYDMLDDNGKLEVLSKLLNNHIDEVLNEIKRTLSELEPEA
jgi:methyl coenzyme M reductase beta subunit